MSIVYYLGVIRHHLIPILFELFVVIVGFQILIGFQISDEDHAFIKDNGYTVFTVAWSLYDLTFNTETCQKRAAVICRDNCCAGFIDRIILQPFVSCKDRIGIMNKAGLRFQNDKFYSLSGQFADKSHMVGVIVSS